MPFFARFLRFIYYFSVVAHTDCSLKTTNRFFCLAALSYYFTPAYIITSLAHRRFGIFLSNMTCGGWEVDTNFKLFWCVTFLVFPRFGSLLSSDSLHCLHGLTDDCGNEQFSELGY